MSETVSPRAKIVNRRLDLSHHCELLLKAREILRNHKKSANFLKPFAEKTHEGDVSMAMLDRYRKTGGFVQLVSLVETCPPAKQEKFLEIIRGEDPRWAEAVRNKILTIERIYGWNNDTLNEIFGTLQDLTVAVALHACNEEMRARINGFFSHGRRRKIEDLFSTNQPSAQEIAAMHMKIIESVRKMDIEGTIRFEKFDPPMEIDEDIEDKIAKAPRPEGASTGSNVLNFGSFDVDTSVPDAATGSSASPATGAGGDESRIMEIQALKKRVAELSKENAVIRHELSVVKSKLDQIKKIA